MARAACDGARFNEPANRRSRGFDEHVFRATLLRARADLEAAAEVVVVGREAGRARQDAVIAF